MPITVIHKLTDKVTIMVIRNSMMWYKSLIKIKKNQKNRFKSKKSDLNQKKSIFLIFIKKIAIFINPDVKTCCIPSSSVWFIGLSCNEFVAVCSQYSHVDLMTHGKIRNVIWDNFARTVSLWYYVVYFTLFYVYVNFCVFICTSSCVCICVWFHVCSVLSCWRNEW